LRERMPDVGVIKLDEVRHARWLVAGC
jgi:hypothetical protein